MVTVSRYHTKTETLRSATPPFAWHPGLPCTSPDHDPDLWHQTGDGDGPAAKRLCQRCPLLRECATWAIETRQAYGIWGATTPADRERLAEKATDRRTA